MTKEKTIRKDLEKIIIKNKELDIEKIHKKWRSIDKILDKYGIFAFVEICKYFENEITLDTALDGIIKLMNLEQFKKEGVIITKGIDSTNQDLLDCLRLLNQVYRLRLSDNKMRSMIRKNKFIEIQIKQYKMIIENDKIKLDII